MITNEQWEEIRAELKRFLGQVTFKLGENVITARRQMASESELKIHVYIDEVIKIHWMGKKAEKPEAVKQVWRDRRYVYDPCFRATKTLISQYKKIDGLELIKIGG